MMRVAAGSGDIISQPPIDTWGFVGFFTPDYRHRAERLGKELVAQDAPFHFFARDKGNLHWRQVVRMKPRIVLDAMDAYPQASLILTDVDNSVLGDPRPILDFQGDVSAGMEARMKWTFGTRNRIKANISSRIMVFRPTAAARKLAEMWLWECEENPRDYKRAGDELQLLVAFMN